jgi:hypothetical protein
MRGVARVILFGLAAVHSSSAEPLLQLYGAVGCRPEGCCAAKSPVMIHGVVKDNQLVPLWPHPSHNTSRPPAAPVILVHRSTQVDDPVSSYAVGAIKGNQLVVPHPPTNPTPLTTHFPPAAPPAVACRSTQVYGPVSSYAVGVIKGNQLVLVPLDFTLQLRPNMAYLNPSESTAVPDPHAVANM